MATQLSWKLTWNDPTKYPAFKSHPDPDYHPLIRLKYAMETSMEVLRNGNAFCYTPNELTLKICTSVSFNDSLLMTDDKVFENICLISVIDKLIDNFDRLKSFHWGKFFRTLNRCGFTNSEQTLTEYFINEWNFDIDKINSNFMRSGSVEPSAKPNKSSTPGAGKERGVKRQNKYDSLYSRWTTREWIEYMRSSNNTQEQLQEVKENFPELIPEVNPEVPEVQEVPDSWD